MSGDAIELHWVREQLGVFRLAVDTPVAAVMIPPNGLFSMTRTHDELSLIAPWNHRETLTVAATRCEGPFAAVRVAGTLPMTLVGVLARLATTLADAGIPIFALSTFDTDYILVRADDADRAADAWRASGITVRPPSA